MSKTLLCMVRHGETEWNAAGRIQGQLDVPLALSGLQQAEAAANALEGQRFAAIYSSDLTRAARTAASTAVRVAVPIRSDARLRERHYGDFQTFTYPEAKERFPADYARFKDRDPEFDFNTGESLRAFFERSVTCVAELAARHPDQVIAVFTHGGVLEMVYRHATGRGLSSPRDFELPNAALNWVEVEGDRWDVRRWADVSHLGGALDELPG